jgi:hypothetical protein
MGMVSGTESPLALSLSPRGEGTSATFSPHPLSPLGEGWGEGARHALTAGKVGGGAEWH